MNKVRLTQLALLTVLVGGLEAVYRSGLIRKIGVVPPSDIVLAAVSIVRTQPWFWPDVAFTLRSMAIASVSSIVIGFACGLGVNALPRLRKALDPLIASYYAVPTFAFYPLIISFVGIGPASLIVMGTLTAFVAMMVATMAAADRIPTVYLKVSRLSRLDPVRSALFIKLPACAPQLFTGLKLAITYSVLGVIAGEFLLSADGIGHRIVRSYDSFNDRAMYAIMVMVLIFVGTLNAILRWIELRINARWARS